MNEPARGGEGDAVAWALGSDLDVGCPLEKEIMRPTTIASGIEAKIQSRTPASVQASQFAKCTTPMLTAAPSSCTPQLPQRSFTISAD
jgi:hypothetical protein